jgi:hypothetical protein
MKVKLTGGYDETGSPALTIAFDAENGERATIRMSLPEADQLRQEISNALRAERESRSVR